MHHTPFGLMTKNIHDACMAIYKIENGIIRRKPTISRWKGFYMTSYKVDGKTRWNYAYRIEEDTIYVEDACHAQNMSEFSSFTTSTSMPQQRKYWKLTKKPFFGYSFVMNDRKEYNLIDNNGQLFTKWFKAIKPLSKPYGKYQIIAYINVGGMFCALSYNGQVHNLGKTWKKMYTENRNILNTQLFINRITENIDNIMNTNKKVVRLSKSKLRNIIAETVKKVLNEIGDTHRGQYMIGRASARADKNGRYDSLAPNYHKGEWNVDGDFEQGYGNQGDYEDAKQRGEFYPNRSKMDFDYKWRETADADEQQSNFINWMEHDKNNPLENAVDYLRGDKSEFGNLINMYEDYLGYELSPKSIKNIKNALNTWWNYNECYFEDIN